jgi:hypothetical protein
MALAYSFRFSVNHLSIDAESNANETIWTQEIHENAATLSNEQ